MSSSSFLLLFSENISPIEHGIEIEKRENWKFHLSTHKSSLQTTYTREILIKNFFLSCTSEKELKNWPWPTKNSHISFLFENNSAAHYALRVKSDLGANVYSGWPILHERTHFLSHLRMKKNYLTVLHMILTIEKMPRDWKDPRDIVSRLS